jgi:hypothetical protein
MQTMLVRYVRNKANWRSDTAELMQDKYNKLAESRRNERAAECLDELALHIEAVNPEHPVIARLATLQDPRVGAFQPDNYTSRLIGHYGYFKNTPLEPDEAYEHHDKFLRRVLAARLRAVAWEQQDTEIRRQIAERRAQRRPGRTFPTGG